MLTNFQVHVKKTAYQQKARTVPAHRLVNRHSKLLPQRWKPGTRTSRRWGRRCEPCKAWRDGRISNKSSQCRPCMERGLLNWRYDRLLPLPPCCCFTCFAGWIDIPGVAYQHGKGLSDLCSETIQPNNSCMNSEYFVMDHKSVSVLQSPAVKVYFVAFVFWMMLTVTIRQSTKLRQVCIRWLWWECVDGMCLSQFLMPKY